MTNIILISNGARPRLLEQTLRTLIQNTSAPFNLTIVDDGCNPSVSMVTGPYDGALYDISKIRVAPSARIIGRLKNLGAYWSEKQFGRGEWLCFLDDDLAFFPGWLDNLIKSMADHAYNRVALVGGCRHPFHGENWSAFQFIGTDAVAGYCHFLRWGMWDSFGPYDAHAKGTGQSEDWKLCNDMVLAGFKVGYIHPPVMAHTGITDSQGKRILGAEQIVRVTGVLYL